MAKHRGAPLRLIKLTLIDEFHDWCQERNTTTTNENLIEFLIQRKFIKGKQFALFCDNITISPTWFSFVHMEPLREGFIPPDSWITK